MITIALDEGGSFEYDKMYLNDRQSIKTPFVGGIIFECESKSEKEKELARLETFLKSACTEAKTEFPMGLHYNRNQNTNAITNRDAVNRVKQLLEEKLPEFMKTSPNGCYYVYAIITDRIGMREMTRRGISNLQDDNLAANRYEHMAYRVIENLVFMNPRLDEKEVQLDLATRSLPGNVMVGRSKAADDLGYQRFKTIDSYIVTSASSYKAAINAAMLNSPKNDIYFMLNVKSIDYKETADTKNEGFLYLADTICSVFQNVLYQVTDLPKAMNQLLERGQRLTGPNKTMLFAYSDIDQVFREAYRDYEQRNYFDSLIAMKNGVINKIPGYDIYQKIWFNTIEKRIEEDYSLTNLQIALEKLDDYQSQPDCNLLVARDIQNVLEKQIYRKEREKLPAILLFRFYRTKMTINNHLGDYEMAQYAYKKCMEVSNQVSVEEYLELRNMYSVSLLDQQRTKEALEYTKQTCNYEELLKDIKLEIYPNHDEIYVHFGRTLSQLGQCYAFCGEYEEAESCFAKAINFFGERQIDRFRTLSYYLHALIEAGEEKQYRLLSKEFFGTESIAKQFEAISIMDAASKKYALYVYIKALFMLFKEDVVRKAINGMIGQLEEEYAKNKDAHPWEMIWKYAAFLTVFTNDGRNNDKAKILMKKAAEAVTTSEAGIVKKIVADGEKQFELLINGQDPFSETDLLYMYR